MADTTHIKKTFERNVEALKLRPALGQITGLTKVRLRDGTTCDIENGEWKFTVDVGKEDGGNNAGPGPGVLERAALGSCLAIGYSKWAAKLNVPIEQVEVEVESEFDARGMFGVVEQPPGFDTLKYKVSVSSSASEEDILRVLNKADAHSPVLDDLKRSIPLGRKVEIKGLAANNKEG